MERFLIKELNKWCVSPRRKPLILNGARQVGKTFLLKEFGARNFKNVIYCNFERDRELHRVFESSLSPHKIIPILKAHFDSAIDPRETFIIFDEIQECGPALTSLKYFFEEAAEYAVAAAGSLLGITLTSDSSFPVGSVNMLSLFPLSFFEFAVAMGKESIISLIRDQGFDSPIPAPSVADLMVLLAHYQYVGGMPEAAQQFVETGSYADVREIHSNINKSYISDFGKHAPSDKIADILAVWEIIPAMLQRENKKFTFSQIKRGARASKYEAAITWLVQAGVVRQVKRVSHPQIPLRVHEDHNVFKLYYLDVGLLSSLLNIPSSFGISPERLLGNYSGAIAECFVAQELGAMEIGPLHYWVSSGLAEVDFLLELRDQVIPLEVKAGHNVKSRSLTSYIEKYQPKLALRTSLQNINTSGSITNLPLYALELIQRL